MLGVRLGQGCFPCFAGWSNGAQSSQNCGSCGPGLCTLPQNCSLCPAGTYSSDSSKGCFPCDPGFYSSSPGSSLCSPVPPGATSYPPFNNYTLCPGGRVSSDGSDCVPCSPGQFSPPASSTCYDCPPGTWSAQPSSSCQPCPAGTANPRFGETDLSACVDVEPGYYSYAAAKMALPCPPGYACPGGTTPQACLPFFDAAPLSSSCSPTVWLFIFVPACVLVLGWVIVAVVLGCRGYFSAPATVVSSMDIGKRKGKEESERLVEGVKYMGY